MKLSNQAVGAIMLALQKAVMEQSDVTETLNGFEIVQDADGPLIITNPPVIKFDQQEDA